MRISYNFLPVVSGPTLVAAYWHTSVPSSTFPLLTDFQQIHLGFPKQWFNQKERLSGWRQFNLLMVIKFITCIIAFSLDKYWLSQEKIDVDHFWDLKGLWHTTTKIFQYKRHQGCLPLTIYWQSFWSTVWANVNKITWHLQKNRPTSKAETGINDWFERNKWQISIGTFRPGIQTTFSAVLFIYPKRYFLYTFKLDFPETFGQWLKNQRSRTKMLTKQNK